MRKLVLLFIIICCLVSCSTVTKFKESKVAVEKIVKEPVHVEMRKVRYNDTNINVFDRFDDPLPLTILNFRDEQESVNRAITIQFTQEFEKRVSKKFKLIAPRTIRRKLILNSIVLDNPAVFKDLRDKLKLEAAIVGKIINAKENSFNLSVVDLRTGETVFTKDFFDSFTSNSVDDAIKRIFDNKEADYYKERVICKYKNVKKMVIEDRNVPYEEKQLNVGLAIGVAALVAAGVIIATK